MPPRPVTAPRRVYLLQRKAARLGATLGKTTGWIHRAALKARGVVMRNGVTYERIDDHGLHITAEKGAEVLEVDHVIICAGQESVNGLADELAWHRQTRARDRRRAAGGGARCRTRHPRRHTAGGEDMKDNRNTQMDLLIEGGAAAERRH